MDDWKQIAEGKELLELRLRTLPPATTFHWRVQTVLIRGAGPMSEICCFTTPDARPGSAPRRLRTVEVGTDYVVLAWQPPRFPNGTIVSYMYVSQKDRGSRGGARTRAKSVLEASNVLRSEFHQRPRMQSGAEPCPPSNHEQQHAPGQCKRHH